MLPLSLASIPRTHVLSAQTRKNYQNSGLVHVGVHSVAHAWFSKKKMIMLVCAYLIFSFFRFPFVMKGNKREKIKRKKNVQTSHIHTKKRWKHLDSKLSMEPYLILCVSEQPMDVRFQEGGNIFFFSFVC